MISRIVEALQQQHIYLESEGLQRLEGWSGKVQTDNRLLAKGDIFVCIKGASFDGHRFIPEAIKAGAAMIVANSKLNGDVPWIAVSDTRKAAALIARITMLPLALPYTLIGVTGTNGKTTTTLMIYEALRKLGHRCGWIGTLGYYIDGEHFPTLHTTPDIIQLNAIFAQMAAAGLTYIVMEVSSHALSLDRVYGVQFDYCLFTNLSRDHLDFHGEMSSYAEAKYKLFEQNMAAKAEAIINTDDQFGGEICQRLTAAMSICHSVGYGNADFIISQAHTDIQNTSFAVGNAQVSLNVYSRLIGGFNIQNLALTAVTLWALGFTPETIQQAIKTIPPVVGRFERIENKHGFGVFIDYAHTPDALENLLKAAHELPHRRILCLLGAGGDRDKGKRPLMLKAALKYSDAVIVTDDNPRSENPDAVIRDIVINCDIRLPWWIIRERALAIKSVIHMAQPGDLVLICGKGHEQYQEIEGVRQHFSDHEVAREALTLWKSEVDKADDCLILPLDATLLKLLFIPDWEPTEQGYTPPQSYAYVSSDTRTIKPNSLFVAIRGEKYDGHSYLDEVLSHPDNCAIAEIPLNQPSVQVENSAKAMGLICQKYLQMFGVLRLAITGSTGKTTTKELIANILRDKAPTLKTNANENNLIGVCKTILRVMTEHQYAVFELGTNHFGEIAALAEIVNPDIGIINNIGPAHLEAFGDEDGVYKEKIELFKRPLALRLYPSDDERFAAYSETGKGVGFVQSSAYRISHQVFSTNTQSFQLNGLEWCLPYGAPYYALNAAFGIALALELGFEAKHIQTSLNRPLQLELRNQLEPRGSGLLLIDCYNANPASMQKALEYWQQLEPAKPHIAILGDMLELGDSSAMFHQMISAMLAEMKPHRLITVGGMSLGYHSSVVSDSTHWDSAEELIASGLLHKLPDDAIILVKASHGIHLDRLIPTLKGE